MKKKFLLLILLSFCLLNPFLLRAAKTDGATNINKILVQPGLLSEKLIIEADGPVFIDRAFYLNDSSKTLVLDIAGAKVKESVVASGGQFIPSIQVKSVENNDVRFFIELSERVPCRLISDSERTILEFAKIQRGKTSYPLDSETQAKLERQPKKAILLNKLDYRQNSDSVSFMANLTGQALAQVFSLENPPRLVVDLFDTVLTAKADVWPVNNAESPVQRLRVAQFQLENPRSITRLVFDLKEPGLFTLDSTENSLTVAFLNPNTAAKPAKSASDLPAQLISTIKNEAPNNPTPLKTPPSAPATSPATGNPEPKTAVTEPARPAREPGTQQVEQKTSAAEAQKEKFKPRVIAAEEERYSGEIISLKFKDADLRDVILFLAEFAGLNVVFDPDVRGTVSCNLQDVPWDQALDIVLKQNKMGKTIEGNVLRIAPTSVLMREEEELRKIKESRELAGPVHVKTITLSYSKAKDVAGLIKTKLSSRGEIIIDDRTNTLLITDVKDKIDLIEKLIAVVDTPTPQVSIEARIVEATATFIRNLGIQWGFRGIADPFYGNATSLEFPNKVLVDGAIIPQGIVTKGIGGPLGGYAVNLPAPAFNTAIGFSFANILDTFRLDIALSALETAGEGRIISLPKVTTQNNQQAEIIQGRQIPVQTVANFTVTTRYVNAALELRATPQITAEGTIIMTVEIQNNAADFANLVSGIPPITTQSAKTTVMVPDGGTTVIGGIYRTEDSVTRERVPFLHQIPILGSMFKNFARTKQQRELLIFITPRIMR